LLCVGEAEIAVLSPSELATLVGQYASWNYFQSINVPINNFFKSLWGATSFVFDLTDPPIQLNKIVNDPMEAHYIGFTMWKQAVIQASTTEIEAVRAAMYGQKVIGLTGNTITMNTNHHLSKPVFIGTITAAGQFNIVQNNSVTFPQNWSPYLSTNVDPANTSLTSICDWSYPIFCCKCYINQPTYTNYFASLGE